MSVIEQTAYTPKPGRFADVLATRHKASRIRLAELGLPAGRVYAGGGDGEAARVFWQCHFPSREAQVADMAARAASAAFTQVRADMTTLIDDFSRDVLELASSPRDVIREHPIAGTAIVPEVVTFPARGRILTGYLFKPEGRASFPCMISNHGSGIVQGSDDLCRPGSAAFLLGLGIGVFLPHRAGYGASPGTPWRSEVSAAYGTPDYDRQLSARLDAESEDVLAALVYLRTRGDVEHGHIGVIGSSFGGTVTLLAAAKSDGFRCAVEFAGAAMNWEKAPSLREEMKRASRRLSCPIYFIQAQTDYSTAPTRELGAEVDGLIPGARSKVFPPFGLTRDEGHFFHRDGSLVWGDEVAAFLQQWL